MRTWQAARILEDGKTSPALAFSKPQSTTGGSPNRPLDVSRASELAVNDDFHQLAAPVSLSDKDRRGRLHKRRNPACNAQRRLNHRHIGHGGQVRQRERSLYSGLQGTIETRRGMLQIPMSN